MTDTELIMQQLQKMEKRFDGIDGRLDGIDGRLDLLDQKIDDVELALDTEINKVYLMAKKNSDDIQLLLPYKDTILNAGEKIGQIDEIKKNQEVMADVVASHSEKFRRFKLIKK